MFDYPLILGRNTNYSRLELSPEATEGDILDAKGELLQALNIRKKELEKRLSAIYESIPKLQTARSKLKALHEESETINPSEYKAILKEISELEKQAQKTDPKYKNYEAEIEQIDRKTNEINLIKLENNEERKKYDQLTPPCILLKFEDFETAVLSDHRTKLFNIRKELARFLEEEKNIACFHPSDLTRRIFISDYEYNQLLDEEEL